MAKQTQVRTIGSNVVVKQEGTILWFGYDTAQQGVQTKGSKGLDSKGRPKKPNEMVGSTGSYVTLPITDDDGRELSYMGHLIRPMSVQSVRKARALREVAEDEAVEAPTTGGIAAKLAAAGLSLAEAKELAALEGKSIVELLASL